MGWFLPRDHLFFPFGAGAQQPLRNALRATLGALVSFAPFIGCRSETG